MSERSPGIKLLLVGLVAILFLARSAWTRNWGWLRTPWVRVAGAVWLLGLVQFEPVILQIGQDYLLIMVLGAMPMALMPILRRLSNGLM